MIKDVNDLKDIIIWAKAQKVKSLKIGEISFDLSDLALVEGLAEFDSSKPSTDLSTPPSSPRLPDGNAQANEEEEELFWSTR